VLSYGGSLKTLLLFVAGVFLLWSLTVTLQAVAGPGPDRSPVIEAPLALLVLGAPALSWLLRAGRGRLRWPLLAGQLGCYVLYETGISIETNIRIDVFLLYPAILLNAWILFREARPARSPAVPLPATVRWAAIFGLLVASIGLVGSVCLLVSPPLLANYTAFVAQSQIQFPTQEARQAALDRLWVPPWFRPYCFGAGAAGFAVSSFFLAGAWRLRRSAPGGPRLFRLGAALYMVVAGCITAAGLVSSSPMVRASLAPAVGLLVVTGILLTLVRRSTSADR
jgi:hypothetical protein